ncbi:hypothetical protein VTJ04DRAFT_5264 [Mycothermus thermophilus]|uniref:uncharacterized protein n=1 Tax=Humicola insolens TaxID=85995 RepID=UPI003742BF5F
MSSQTAATSANSAPGKTSSSGEDGATCYNCGATGHWFQACPEPARPIPAGLEKWKQSRERGAAPQDKKGPVVITHWPPPPPGPGVPYGQPPPPGYAPGVPPPPPGYPGAYPGGYRPPAPPAPYGQYPVPPPPPPPGSYGQHQAPPPPYGQPQYPGPYPSPQAYYPPGTTPPTPPAPNAYSPPALPPSQYGPPPPPGVSPYPSSYQGPTPPPPPGVYPFASSSTPPYGPPTTPGPAFPPPPPGSWQPTPPPGVSPSVNRGRNHKDRHDRHGQKRHQNRDKSRNNQDKRGNPGAQNERQDNRPKKEDDTKPDHGRKDEAHDTQKKHSEDKKDDQKDSVEDADEYTIKWESKQLEEDFKLAFPKETTTKSADPVGIPLPLEYTEDPTIPPAYNATCVKSEYFRDDNKEEFARSIRQNPVAWIDLINDPVFKKYRGMVSRQFPDSHYEYPTYEPSGPPPSSGSTRLPPRFYIDPVALKEGHERMKKEIERMSKGDGKPAPNGHQPSHQGSHRPDHDENRPRKRSVDERPENTQDERDTKRARVDHPQGRPRDNAQQTETPNRSQRPHIQQSTTSPRLGPDADPWVSHPGENNARGAIDRRYSGPSQSNNHRRPSDSYGDSRPTQDRRTSYADRYRQDSGYHSAQSAERSNVRSYRDDDRRRGLDSAYRSGRRRSRSRTRSPSVARGNNSSRRNGSPARPGSRGADRDRGRGGDNVRGRGGGGRESRASTRSDSTPSRSDRDRSESPLSDMDMELLGMARSEKKEEKKPVKKVVKRAAVPDVFGRRW